MQHDNLFIVGEYKESFNLATEQSLPCGPIYQSVGLITHIKKRHPNEVDNLKYISDIIAKPDYIGKHPNESDSIELVKVLENNVMACIKLDSNEGYLFVASIFEISDSKLKNRLNSGRLKNIDNHRKTWLNIGVKAYTLMDIEVGNGSRRSRKGT